MNRLGQFPIMQKVINTQFDETNIPKALRTEKKETQNQSHEQLDPIAAAAGGCGAACKRQHRNTLSVRTMPRAQGRAHWHGEIMTAAHTIVSKKN